MLRDDPVFEDDEADQLYEEGSENNVWKMLFNAILFFAVQNNLVPAVVDELPDPSDYCRCSSCV